MHIEKNKIWLYLTVEKKQIHLTPPEDTEMTCKKVSIATFNQILKDGFYRHKDVFAAFWGTDPEVVYKLTNQFVHELVKQKIERLQNR